MPCQSQLCKQPPEIYQHIQQFQSKLLPVRCTESKSEGCHLHYDLVRGPSLGTCERLHVTSLGKMVRRPQRQKHYWETQLAVSYNETTSREGCLMSLLTYSNVRALKMENMQANVVWIRPFPTYQVGSTFCLCSLLTLPCALLLPSHCSQDQASCWLLAPFPPAPKLSSPLSSNLVRPLSPGFCYAPAWLYSSPWKHLTLSSVLFCEVIFISGQAPPPPSLLFLTACDRVTYKI